MKRTERAVFHWPRDGVAIRVPPRRLGGSAATCELIPFAGRIAQTPRPHAWDRLSDGLPRGVAGRAAGRGRRRLVHDRRRAGAVGHAAARGAAEPRRGEDGRRRRLAARRARTAAPRAAGAHAGGRRPDLARRDAGPRRAGRLPGRGDRPRVAGRAARARRVVARVASGAGEARRTLAADRRAAGDVAARRRDERDRDREGARARNAPPSRLDVLRGAAIDGVGARRVARDSTARRPSRATRSSHGSPAADRTAATARRCRCSRSTGAEARGRARRDGGPRRHSRSRSSRCRSSACSGNGPGCVARRVACDSSRPRS